MSFYEWPSKGPTEVFDYKLDWVSVLAGDTISTSTFTVSPSGLTLDSQSFIGSISTVWLSGGTVGVQYVIKCTITTAAARTFVRTILLNIENL